MIARVIELCATHRVVVLAVVLALSAWAVVVARETPLDALPDLSDPQVIVEAHWPGQSPDLVEDQVTAPLVRALQGLPEVRDVRGYAMFGMAFVYAIFDDGANLDRARAGVFERISRARSELPPGVDPRLGPDATGVGWVFQYVLEDRTGTWDLARLRTFHDTLLAPALQAVPGVAEIATLGGFEQQLQVIVDPHRLLARGLTVDDVTRAVTSATGETGGRVVEVGGREILVRARGRALSPVDLEQAVIGREPTGQAIALADVAVVGRGPELRRGAADWNGRGEAVGGIVVMRSGENALAVIEAVERRLDALAFPDGLRWVPGYDRSTLIEGSVATLTGTLLEEALVVALVCLLFLMHVRSALVAIVILPLSMLLAFLPMRALGLNLNIMALGGIAIAIGELVDAVIVLVENAHVRLAGAPPGADRRRVVIDAAKEVGAPIFFSLLLITVSFLPIFTLAGQAGRLFTPLALTKTFSMLAAALLSVTLAPALMVWLIRGRIRPEARNPLTRLLVWLYRPVATAVVRFRWVVLAAALGLVLATVPVARRLGSEFMPPLDEGTLLVMPTTFAGISIEEARRAMSAQNRAILEVPEVATALGKVGRAETATDPAQIDMIETIVTLRDRHDWPTTRTERFWSGLAPGWLRGPLETLWPEEAPRSLAEVTRDVAAAAELPGFQMAVGAPIRTRLDMLSTGVRTAAGVKVLGDDLAHIESVSLAIERLLREVPGTRSTFAERQSGREYLDITPRRDALLRHGVTVTELLALVQVAIGGAPVASVVDGRSRVSINVRYGADHRSDVDAIARLPVPVGAARAADEPGPRAMGTGAASPGMSPISGGGGGVMGDGMAGMGDAVTPAPATMAAMAPGPVSAAPAGADGTPSWRLGRAWVPLGDLADVRVVTGPPMIRDENGRLAGYVFIDVDTASRDLGSWVAEAKALVSDAGLDSSGVEVVWTGQIEQMGEVERRLTVVIPLTLALVLLLLRLSLGSWPQTWLVLLSLPFALVGSLWLLDVQGYHLSAAVWVGLIAVLGVAAQTGTVMVVYLDEAVQRAGREGRLRSRADMHGAIVEGAALRVRPLVMTVATTVLGLLPLLYENGAGADVTARTAAPLVGGLASCMALTLLVLPAAYAAWRGRQGGLAAPVAEVSTVSGEAA